MKILVKDYVLSYEDDTLSVVENESEKEVISLSGDELKEFKRALGYLEQEANV